MNNINTLHFINHDKPFVLNDKTLYITFSNILNKTLIQRGVNSKYLFPKKIDYKLKNEINNLSECLRRESEKYYDKRWFTITFKFIYKYLPIYNNFYDSIRSEIKFQKNIKYIKISKKLSHICQSVLIELSNIFNLEIIYTDEDFLEFTDYPYYLATDIPERNTIDKHNIFIYIIAKLLKFKNHHTFISPAIVDLNIPKNVNYFKIGYFSILNKILSKFRRHKDLNFEKYIPSINFNKSCRAEYNLDKTIWAAYRDDQINYIENIINIVLKKYPNDYIDLIKTKVKLILLSSNTKKLIIDDTFEVMKRIMISSANDLKINIEFLPHGIVCEDEHINILKTQSNKIRVLAWTEASKASFVSNDIDAKSIKYPVNTSFNKKTLKKDILILMSGGRARVNSYEDIITTFLDNQSLQNIQIDWKYHKTSSKSQFKAMNHQYNMMKDYYKRDISLINPNIKLIDIISDYKMLGFTTWTTGIFEAALSNVPFFIYTKEIYNIGAFSNIDMPIADNIDDCITLIERKHHPYLKDIQKSLINNPLIF